MTKDENARPRIKAGLKHGARLLFYTFFFNKMLNNKRCLYLHSLNETSLRLTDSEVAEPGCDWLNVSDTSE